MFHFTRSIFILLTATVIFAAASIGQVPTPTPDEAPPVSPDFTLPVRPMPSAERIGVNAADQMSLTLDQAIEMALRNNNDIDASRNDSKITDLRLDGARGVYDPLITSDNYYERATTPTASLIGGAVNGAVTQTRFFNSGGLSGFTPVAGGSYSAIFNASRTTTSNTNSFLNPQFPSSVTFNYNQPLFRDRAFDSNRRGIEIAKKNQLISDSSLQLKAIDVIASVEAAYWDLTFALRNLQVQTDNLKQARDQLESNKRLVDKGVLAPIEIVAANAQISTYEQVIFAAQEGVTRAENTLKTLLLPDRSSVEWTRPLTPVTPVTLTAPRQSLDLAVTEALKNRPEIAQLETTADINGIDQKFYRNQKKPQVDLYGIYTTSGLAGTETAAAFNPTTGLSRVPPNLVGGYLNSLGNLLQQDYPTFRVGVSISLPWGNRVAKANLGETMVEADRIRNLRAQAEQRIEAEVRNALQALKSAEARLVSATAARVAAEELFASEERLFRGGTTTFYLVVQRQTDLLIARSRELQSQTDLNKAISEYQRSVGSTLSVHNVTVSK
ncbi:MAG: TolC family protein [Pyrinomonadaceae bacterium]|nr:TolC family protein [Pyrinomonadaceae bacterium]MBP6212023.1 TolC family protein [Pyrinomonadaceae bacterium]